MPEDDKDVFNRAESDLRKMQSELQINADDLLTVFLLIIANDVAVPLPAALSGLTTNYAAFLLGNGSFNDEKLAISSYLGRVGTDLKTFQYVLCTKIAQARAIASVQVSIPTPLPPAPYIPPPPKRPALTPAPSPTPTPTPAQVTVVAGFFGDSITFGLGATSNASRWSSLLTAQKNSVNTPYQELNTGISGTVLQNSAPTQTDNGRDRYVATLIGKGLGEVYILYGLNDLRFNGASFSVVNYETQLNEIVQGLIASGIAANKITIGSPPYILASAYSQFSPFNTGSVFKHKSYRDAAARVAFARGTRYADVYQSMLDNGNDSLVSADLIHPNDSGHLVIKNAMIAGVVQSVAPTPTIQSGNVLQADLINASNYNLNGSNVSLIQDQSNLDNDFVQTTAANQPLFISGGGKGGKNIARFTDDFLTSALEAGSINSHSVSIFMAVKSNAIATQGIYCNFDTGVIATSFAVQQLDSKLNIYYSSARDTAIAIPTGWFVFSVVSSAANISVRVISTSTQNASLAAIADTALSPTFIVGRFVASTPIYAPFDLGEVRVYTGAMSSTDRTAIEAEMVSRWV